MLNSKTNFILIAQLLVQCSSAQENFTDLINEITPKVFPGYTNPETELDATFLDVYDGSSGCMVNPSCFVLIVPVILSVFFLWNFWRNI